MVECSNEQNDLAPKGGSSVEEGRGEGVQKTVLSSPLPSANEESPSEANMFCSLEHSTR